MDVVEGRWRDALSPVGFAVVFWGFGWAGEYRCLLICEARAPGRGHWRCLALTGIGVRVLFLLDSVPEQLSASTMARRALRINEDSMPRRDR